MFELLIIIVTFFMTEGALGAKLINIMDNLNVFYWIFFIIFVFIPMIVTIIFSLVGGAVASKFGSSKVTKVIAFLTGMFSTSATLSLFFAYAFSGMIIKIFATSYLESSFNPNMTSFSQINSEQGFVLSILILLFVLSLIFKKNKKRKQVKGSKKFKISFKNNSQKSKTALEAWAEEGDKGYIMKFVKILSYSEMYSVFEEQKLDIEYLCQNNIFPIGDQELFFFCLYKNEKIIGVLKLKTKGSESLSSPGFYNWLGFISIKEEFQGLGFSKLLLRSLFEFLKERKFDHLLSSGYSEKGYNSLRKELFSLSKEFEILFKDKDEISF